MNSIQGLLLPAIVVVLFCAIAHSQLTFSPYWGKRSSADIDSGLYGPAAAERGDCRNANQMLKDIFRFIQMKAAQLSADCNRGQ